MMNDIDCYIAVALIILNMLRAKWYANRNKFRECNYLMYSFNNYNDIDVLLGNEGLISKCILLFMI